MFKSAIWSTSFHLKLHSWVSPWSTSLHESTNNYDKTAAKQNEVNLCAYFMGFDWEVTCVYPKLIWWWESLQNYTAQNLTNFSPGNPFESYRKQNAFEMTLCIYTHTHTHTHIYIYIYPLPFTYCVLLRPNIYRYTLKEDLYFDNILNCVSILTNTVFVWMIKTIVVIVIGLMKLVQ